MSFAGTFNALLSLSSRFKNWALNSEEIVESLKRLGIETLEVGATPDQVYVRSLVDLRWDDPDLPTNVLEMFGDDLIRSAFKSYMTDESNQDFIAQAEERFRVQGAEAYLLQFQLVFLKNAKRAASTDTMIILRRIEELEQKQNALNEASEPQSLSINNLMLRNPNFTGRDEILGELRETLEEGKAAALTALYGLGGIGKTQVALEYTYRYAGEYDVIWWVKAETEASRTADIEAFARELKLTEVGQTSDVVREAVRKWLRNAKEKWLLIFDNAPNPEELKSFLPNGGHVLITSRYQAWGGTAELLEVEKMEPGEAKEFLLKRTKQKDETAADAIAKELDYLPLALEQAGAYVEKTGKSLADYLELYRKRKLEIFESGLAKPSQDYKDTVSTTWTMSFEAAENQCTESGDLLRLCAYFAPDDIPLDVIVEGAEFLPETLAACVKDETKLDVAVAALKDYSLVTRSKKGLSVHRLVQEVTRDRIPIEERKTWIAEAAEIVNMAFPQESDDVRTWEDCNRLLPHGLAAAGYGEKAKVAHKSVGRLLTLCANYFWGHALYEEARDLYSQAIAVCEISYGLDHPSVAIIVNNLGEVLRKQGNLEEAKKCSKRALKIGEEKLGKDHPLVAFFMNNLGLVLQDQGTLEGAKQCFERALNINEKQFGRDHRNVSRDVNNLGYVFLQQGAMENAKQCFERTLKILEKELGENHPNVATAVNNLGAVLQAQGNWEPAIKCFERALIILEKELGENHPNVASTVNNLGLSLEYQGDLVGAKRCFEKALEIFETLLGLNHPETKKVLLNLAGLLEKMRGKG